MKPSSLLDEVQQSVLAAAYQGGTVPLQHGGAIDALGAMGLVALVTRELRGFRVSLTLEGLHLAKKQRDFRRWELWRDLYARLQGRGALERDPTVRKAIFARSKVAYERGLDALSRVSPDIAAEVRNAN